MREVIYKDDAIEAIRNVKYGGSAMRKVLFIKALENVPPAPPVERLIAKFSFNEEKLKEIVDRAIIRCKDCRYYGKIDDKFYRKDVCRNPNVQMKGTERSFCSEGKPRE